MKNKKTFYITTTIPYANAPPHIGFALEIVQADVLARWNTLKGKEVFFLTGTDEHGVKNYQSAKKEGLAPQKFVDNNSAKFRELTKVLDISNNYFIRTTDKEVHWPGVIEMWKRLEKRGDIYKKKYTGAYCSGCERFITEKELINGNCPDHQNLEIQHISEENYFFRLSKYSDKIKRSIRENKLKITPLTWKNDFLALIKDGLTDVSFSREKKHLPWGIPVPGDDNQTMYVWPDALSNYLTGIGFPNKDYKKYWPVDIHVVGKDMLRFHTGIWPGMLSSAGIELPKEVIVHGFLTVGGRKMSKSLGNVISPLELVKKYPSDSIRYVLMRSVPFGEDGDFSENVLVDRHNNELANKLGNLVSRVSTLIEKNGLKKTENKLLKKLKLKEIEKLLDKYEFDKTLNEIFAFVDICNEYVQSKKPWETGDKKILYELADSLKAIAILLWPFIPSTSEKIAKQFNFKINYKEIGNSLKISKISKGEILFKKIDTEVKENEVKTYSELHFDNYKSYLMGASKISNNDLRKMGIKIVEEKEDGDKLLLIPNNKIEEYLKLVELKLDKGFWNEIVGNRIIFIFKSKEGEIKKFTLNDKNAQEIARLCAEFNNHPYETTSDLLGYLLDNEFYSDYVAEIRAKENKKVNKSRKIEGIVSMAETIGFNEWEKIDLRVAQIKKVENIEGADKLYKLTINLGKELGERMICAGIKQHYSKEELKGKKIIVFTNLASRKIKGIESKGMLLAAVNDGHSKVILISPEKDIEPGARIS